MKKFLVLCSLVVMLMGLTAFNASAALMTGGVSFAGNYALNNPIATATQFTSFSSVVITSGSGTWLGASGSATFNPFTFAPPANVTPLWSFIFGGITYNMNAAASSMTVTKTGGLTPTLTVEGNGTLTASSVYSNTTGHYVITANSGGGTFSFSSSSVAVPEPGTLLLLGSGLLGLALTGARKKFRK